MMRVDDLFLFYVWSFCLPQESLLEIGPRCQFKKPSWFHVKCLLKRTMAVMKEMESPKFCGSKINPFRVKEAFFKQTSRDEKHKSMAASHWTDATCLTDFFPMFLCWPAMFICQTVCSFGVEEFAVYNHQDSSTNTRDLTEFGTVLWNQLELSQTGNSCPLWNCLNCYTYSWHKSSEFSQTGRLDPPNANPSPKK